MNTMNMRRFLLSFVYLLENLPDEAIKFFDDFFGYDAGRGYKADFIGQVYAMLQNFPVTHEQDIEVRGQMFKDDFLNLVGHQKITHIKFLRDSLNLGLKEAKDMHDAMYAHAQMTARVQQVKRDIASLTTTEQAYIRKYLLGT